MHKGALYDRLMHPIEDACLLVWRAKLLDNVYGDVIEVGAGTGANLPHYQSSVDRLVLAEPNTDMRTRLQARVAASGRDQVEIIDSSFESLPEADASFDFVVSTLVLCSVTNLSQSLTEAHRVLKPGGRFVFLEHVAADNHPNHLKWQRRIEPLWKLVMGNCHLTRQTATAIIETGFVMEDTTKESITNTLPIIQSAVRGIARKPP